MPLIDEEPEFRAGRSVKPDPDAKRPQIIVGPANQVTSKDLRPRLILAQHIAPGVVGPAHFADDAFVHGGDFESTDSAAGLILKAPNGSRWRVKVSNAGALTVTPVT